MPGRKGDCVSGASPSRLDVAVQSLMHGLENGFVVVRFGKGSFCKLRNFSYSFREMKTVSVREMKANWSEIERQVQQGETFEVLSRGKPSVRIVPATPREILKWDNHLATAVKVAGRSGSEAVDYNRDGRW